MSAGTNGVVRLRVSGTREECAAAVATLYAGFAVGEVSEFYPDRGPSVPGLVVLGRVYLDAAPLTSTPQPERADTDPRSVHQRIGNVEAGATVIGTVLGRRVPRRPRPPRNPGDSTTGGVS